MGSHKSGNLPAYTEEHVRFLFEENCGIDTNQLNFTFGGSKAQVNVLTDLKDITYTIFAFVNSSHINGVRVNHVQHADKDHTICHHVPEVIALWIDWEAFSYILIIVQNIIEQTSDGITLFNLVGVFGSLDNTRKRRRFPAIE